MSVRLDHELIRLEGDCHVEDAEPLLAALLEGPVRTVDLGACGRMHAAVAQVLMALEPELTGAATESFVRDRVVPALRMRKSEPDNRGAP